MAAERLTQERIDGFLEYLEGKGRSAGSLRGYRRIMEKLYEYLPAGKRITAKTGEQWRAWLEEQGLSPRTINVRISVLNSFCQYIGRREWMLGDFYHGENAVQPELTRAEYLRMLGAAKAMDRERSYLIIKTLGGAGLRIQELHQLTTDAVRDGAVNLEYHNHSRQRILHLPATLQGELMDFISREQLGSGPVFLTPEGTPLGRSTIYYYVNCVSQTAQVAEEKANPRCLWKMYQRTYEDIQSNISTLIHQAYNRMLDEEQRSIGWKS